MSDGTLTCWGANEYGQATPPSGTFTQISASSQYTCGLKSDGTIACWGSNEYGRATPPTGTFTQISAGVYHGCGLRSDGLLACWGLNSIGQATPPAETFIQVSAGATHTCGLKSDYTLACWGFNSFGEATPPTGTFTQVSAGGHTCGLRSNGTLACWGYNGYGQAPVILLSPALLPNGMVGQTYVQSLSSSGGVAPYEFAHIGGALPTGLSLTPTGTLQGIATTAGIYTFTLYAIDANTISGNQAYTITINGEVLLNNYYLPVILK
jgi:alpha-tubulin suppressor-like RCC1 family protein